ncbi:WD-40 repeat protein [Streptomyces sp. MUSC 125]|uniref:WD40 repeat domain-containing protein n=1 Tax=unclassified Streptomyces TaxID=2593676 RepID=UPI00057E4603|nr:MULTISPECIES: WD40 repeat domain-containing protein [unclassified Streptomyces]KIE26048.1 WD-40 repeat protein [Streptomyces sp. MUSC 125]MCH0557049.1 WD40 repeat domain-containing protein [Streptomyces sp. MUM 16J]
MGSDSGTARTAFAERLALLYKEAGNPPLKSVAEAVVRLQRVDERGRAVRVSAQRISDWRRARNVPAQFAALAAVLQILIPEARRLRPEPVSSGLYDIGHWQRLWEHALANPPGDRSTAPMEEKRRDPEQAPPVTGGVCPYRGLASYRQQDARWFFGRERSTNALVGQLRAAARTGGLVMLVGASGAGKSSLLNAGLVPALREGALGDIRSLTPTGDGTTVSPGSRTPGLPPGVPTGTRTEGSAQTPTPPAPAPTDTTRPTAPPGNATSPTTTTGTTTTTAAATAPLLQLVPGSDPLGELVRGIPDLAPVAADVRRTEEKAAKNPAASGSDTPRFARAVRTAVSAWACREAGPGSRPVLIVDQFEEAFTLCSDEADRRTFIKLLHAACTPTASSDGPAPALVVLGIRADFYEQCLRYRELADALQHRHMVLGPLTSGELREAVTGPAKAVGLELERGLAELIVREVSADGPRGAHDAGVLPLLSHALLATWQRRKAGKLTLSGYRAAGGIQGAVAATAERAWTGLDPAARTAARLLLLRLVRLGEDTQATRRRGTRRQLAEESADPGKTEESLEALVQARLVTLDADAVEITHEALLHAWPRLRHWIDDNRNDHLLRQRLDEDGRAWEDSGRDSSLLYRGSRLEQARSWAKSAGNTFLTRSAVEFLAASVRLRKRTVWISRAAVAALVVLALLAGGSAVIAWQQRDDAVFEQVLAEADRVQRTDPSLAAQLDLVAHHLRPNDEGTYSRLISIVNAPLATPLSGHTGAVYLTSFSPDGKTLATASYDHTVRLWNVTDPSHPKPIGTPLTGHTSWVSSAVFSPDGHTLASAGDDGTIRLWDVTDLTHPALIGRPLTSRTGTIYLVAFSPDGHTLASASEDHTVRLWDVTDPHRPKQLGALRGPTAAVRSVAFSPDGRTLAAGGDDATIRLWNTTDPHHPEPIHTVLRGHTSIVHSVAFSPDGQTLASGSADDTVRLWDMRDPNHPKSLGSPLTGHTGPVWSVAFSPDGGSLAAASADSTASLWNVRDPQSPSRVGEPLAGSSGEMYALGFSPDGRTLATGSGDSKVRLWSVPTSDVIGRNAAFRPDGRVLATAARDGRLRLWNVAQPGRPLPLSEPFMRADDGQRSLVFSPDGRTLAVLTSARAVYLWDVSDPSHPVSAGPPLRLWTRFMGPNALAYSPDGHILATAYDDRTIRLWNVSDPSRPVPLGDPLTGHRGYINALAFSPDGHTLASGSADSTIRLWNTTDPARPTPLGAPLDRHSGPVNTLAFSPDGQTLASGSDDDTVRLWNVTDPASATPLGAPLTGHTEAVTSLTFSTSGHTLASGGNDNTVRLWNISDPASATPIGQSMSPDAKTGNFLSFSPGSRVLGVSSGTDTVRLWSLDADAAIRHICSVTRGVLTPQKWHEYLPRLSYDPPCGR